MYHNVPYCPESHTLHHRFPWMPFQLAFSDWYAVCTVDDFSHQMSDDLCSKHSYALNLSHTNCLLECLRLLCVVHGVLGLDKESFDSVSPHGRIVLLLAT
eukprot:jgi/Chrzof1/1113/Cz01g40170.t1